MSRLGPAGDHGSVLTTVAPDIFAFVAQHTNTGVDLLRPMRWRRSIRRR
jgi:hypothetical protein